MGEDFLGARDHCGAGLAWLRAAVQRPAYIHAAAGLRRAGVWEELERGVTGVQKETVLCKCENSWVGHLFDTEWWPRQE